METYLTIAILASTFGLLIFTKMSPATIFVGALTLSITFGLAPLEASLKGFSNPGVLTIGALFMIAAGMYSTGAINIISDKLIGRPSSLLRAQLKILPLIAVGSAFLNNTPLVAMMIPVIRDLARSCRLDPKKLYLPLSYASILGGTCTLIGTATNLVIAGMVSYTLASQGTDKPYMREIGMFDLSWIGVPVTLVGLVFLVVLGKWLLPSSKQAGPVSADLERRYFRAEFVVQPGGLLAGRSLKDAGFSGADDFQILSIERTGVTSVEMLPGTLLQGGDIISFSAELPGLKTLWSTHGLKPLNAIREMESERHTHHLVQVVISRRCRVLGWKVQDLPPEDSPYHIWIVGIARGAAALNHPIADTVIQAGDIVVIEVDDSFFYQNRNEREFALVKRLVDATIQRTDKAITATAITLAMVTSVAAGWLPMLNAALLASGAMLLTRCMEIRTAGRSVEFKTLVVIACAMGLEAAVTHSGLSAGIGDMLSALSGDDLYMALAVVFLGCILMDAMVTNVASAVFMFPIAMTIAKGLDVSFMPFVITVMVGASCSFISPVSYQTNLMVYGPGNYSFADFAKVGIPLSIVVGVVTVFLTPVFFPFYP